MRYIISVCLLMLCIVGGQGALAAAPDKSLNNAAPAVMTKVISHVSKDAVTGAEKIRVVFETSGPVKINSSISASPSPRLTINVKGAGRGNVPDTLNFDGNIINKVSVIEREDGSSTLLVDIPTLLGDGDYRIFTLRNDPAANRPYRIVIDVNKPVPPIVYNFTPGLEDKVIAIDAGHGGSDPGAIGLSGAYEKTITLAVAVKVKKMLEKAGSQVIMTRETDCDIAGRNASDVAELSGRTAIANNNKADVFISIHTNSFTDRTVGGSAVYFTQKSAYDLLLAQSLDSALMQNSKLKDRGVSRGNLYLTKYSLMPAALIEMAFISNPSEEKLLLSSAAQQQMAQNIVNGLECFFAEAAKRGGG